VSTLKVRGLRHDAAASDAVNIASDGEISFNNGLLENRTAKTSSFTPDTSAEGTVYSVSGTLTLTMPAAVSGGFFTVIDAGTGTLSWGGTIKWSGGAAPTGSGITIYTFVSDGTNWYGSMAGNGYA
jgi:hypothetical protein